MQSTWSAICLRVFIKEASSGLIAAIWKIINPKRMNSAIIPTKIWKMISVVTCRVGTTDDLTFRKRFDVQCGVRAKAHFSARAMRLRTGCIWQTSKTMCVAMVAPSKAGFWHYFAFKRRKALFKIVETDVQRMYGVDYDEQCRNQREVRLTEDMYRPLSTCSFKSAPRNETGRDAYLHCRCQWNEDYQRKCSFQIRARDENNEIVWIGT